MTAALGEDCNAGDKVDVANDAPKSEKKLSEPSERPKCDQNIGQQQASVKTTTTTTTTIAATTLRTQSSARLISATTSQASALRSHQKRIGAHTLLPSPSSSLSSGSPQSSEKQPTQQSKAQPASQAQNSHQATDLERKRAQVLHQASHQQRNHNLATTTLGRTPMGTTAPQRRLKVASSPSMSSAAPVTATSQTVAKTQPPKVRPKSAVVNSTALSSVNKASTRLRGTTRPKTATAETIASSSSTTCGAQTKATSVPSTPRTQLNAGNATGPNHKDANGNIYEQAANLKLSGGVGRNSALESAARQRVGDGASSVMQSAAAAITTKTAPHTLVGGQSKQNGNEQPTTESDCDQQAAIFASMTPAQNANQRTTLKRPPITGCSRLDDTSTTADVDEEDDCNGGDNAVMDRSKEIRCAVEHRPMATMSTTTSGSASSGSDEGSSNNDNTLNDISDSIVPQITQTPAAAKATITAPKTTTTTNNATDTIVNSTQTPIERQDRAAGLSISRGTAPSSSGNSVGARDKRRQCTPSTTTLLSDDQRSRQLQPRDLKFKAQPSRLPAATMATTTTMSSGASSLPSAVNLSIAMSPTSSLTPPQSSTGDKRVSCNIRKLHPTALATTTVTATSTQRKTKRTGSNQKNGIVSLTSCPKSVKIPNANVKHNVDKDTNDVDCGSASVPLVNVTNDATRRKTDTTTNAGAPSLLKNSKQQLQPVVRSGKAFNDRLLPKPMGQQVLSLMMLDAGLLPAPKSNNGDEENVSTHLLVCNGDNSVPGDLTCYNSSNYGEDEDEDDDNRGHVRLRSIESATSSHATVSDASPIPMTSLSFSCIPQYVGASGPKQQNYLILNDYCSNVQKNDNTETSGISDDDSSNAIKIMNDHRPNLSSQNSRNSNKYQYNNTATNVPVNLPLHVAIQAQNWYSLEQAKSISLPSSPLHNQQTVQRRLGRFTSRLATAAFTAEQSVKNNCIVSEKSRKLNCNGVISSNRLALKNNDGANEKGHPLPEPETAAQNHQASNKRSSARVTFKDHRRVAARWLSPVRSSDRFLNSVRRLLESATSSEHNNQIENFAASDEPTSTRANSNLVQLTDTNCDSRQVDTPLSSMNSSSCSSLNQATGTPWLNLPNQLSDLKVHELLMHTATNSAVSMSDDSSKPHLSINVRNLNRPPKLNEPLPAGGGCWPVNYSSNLIAAASAPPFQHQTSSSAGQTHLQSVKLGAGLHESLFADVRSEQNVQQKQHQQQQQKLELPQTSFIDRNTAEQSRQQQLVGEHVDKLHSQQYLPSRTTQKSQSGIGNKIDRAINFAEIIDNCPTSSSSSSTSSPLLNKMLSTVAVDTSGVSATGESEQARFLSTDQTHLLQDARNSYHRYRCTSARTHNSSEDSEENRSDDHQRSIGLPEASIELQFGLVYTAVDLPDYYHYSNNH